MNPPLKNWHNLATRAVRALEQIAKNGSAATNNTYISSPDGGSPAPAEETTDIKVPAYWFEPEPGKDYIDYDMARSNGHAKIKDDEIVVVLPKQYYTDKLREILARPDLKPAAITVGVSYEAKI